MTHLCAQTGLEVPKPRYEITVNVITYPCCVSVVTIYIIYSISWIEVFVSCIRMYIYETSLQLQTWLYNNWHNL
nr:unnamed protein product [Callosobruchus chinensis]